MKNIFKNALERRKTYKKEREYIKLINTLIRDTNLASLNIFETVKDIFREHVEKQPPARIFQEIATFLLNAGQPELAQKYFLYSLAASCSAETYSLYLQCLLMSPSCTEEQMLNAAKRYDKLFYAKIKRYQHHKAERPPHKKITVGYTCHFFHNAPSQTLLLPYLQMHDRNRFKIICYSDANADEVPNAIKEIADVWRDTKDLSDEDLARIIKTDEVDILVELNGHCVVNRYGTIARKPAPIQVSHYNLSTTSGVSAIDYVLLGEEFNLDQRYYTESIYYHKGVRKAVAFPDYFPPCSQAPFLKNKYVTFGSFGATHKINIEVIKIWSKILKLIPDAKFFMRAATLDHLPFLNAYKQLFAIEGCDPDRITFEGYSDHPAHVQKYSRIDIALDTFPFSGATTIREALWQGVPIVTLCDSTKYCIQHGKAILTSIGHPELVAESVEEYITKATALAKDKERILKYRDTLRCDFKSSPLYDLKKWVTQLEAAYEDIYLTFLSHELPYTKI